MPGVDFCFFCYGYKAMLEKTLPIHATPTPPPDTRIVRWAMREVFRGSVQNADIPCPKPKCGRRILILKDKSNGRAYAAHMLTSPCDFASVYFETPNATIKSRKPRMV